MGKSMFKVYNFELRNLSSFVEYFVSIVYIHIVLN